jgi:hypothetical protein
MICLVPAQAEIKIVTRHLSRPKLDYKVTTQGCYNLYPIVRSPKADKCGPHEPHLEEGLSADRAAKTLSVKAPL